VSSALVIELWFVTIRFVMGPRGLVVKAETAEGEDPGNNFNLSRAVTETFAA